MDKTDAHASAMAIIKALIEAKQLSTSGATDPKELAAYWAAQIKELHRQLTAHFAAYGADKS